MHTKTREEVVKECLSAIAACWNHYSDRQLTNDHLQRLHKVLGDDLPVTIQTTQWKRYAEEREAINQAEINN